MVCGRLFGQLCILRILVDSHAQPMVHYKDIGKNTMNALEFKEKSHILISLLPYAVILRGGQPILDIFGH